MAGLKRKYRVQPRDTGLVWVEVVAKDENEAVEIAQIEFHKMDLPSGILDVLEAHDVTPTLQEMVDDFCNNMPLDQLPDETYKARFIEDLAVFYGAVELTQ